MECFGLDWGEFGNLNKESKRLNQADGGGNRKEGRYRNVTLNTENKGAVH